MHFRGAVINGLTCFIISAGLSGCTLTRAASVYLNSPADLPKVSITMPLYAEAGAESIANDIAAALPASIKRIEATHGGKIGALPDIVVCASDACYREYAATPESAAETLGDRRIIINGAKIQKGKRDAVQLFTHELSHFYWYSHDVGFQPRWFEEGVAVWVSDGGGAENVSVQAAEKAIKAGKAVHPTLDSGFWNYLTQSPSLPDNNWHMFYRQSGMFVQYLHDDDPIAFARLFEALKTTKNLKQAWSIAHKRSPEDIWLEFLRKIQGKGSEESDQKS